MARSDNSRERISSLFVERGLYLLRYDASADVTAPPFAFVKEAEGCEATLQIISAPGVAAGELPRPGSCLVVRAEEPGALHISVRRQQRHTSLDATLRLEPLWAGASEEQAREPRAPDATKSPADSLGANKTRNSSQHIAVMGHVAHRGDIEVAAGDWIAGPDSPSPIEGLEIRVAKNSTIQIETQVIFSGHPPKTSEWVQPGVFAGSRGRRVPLAGVNFRLVGSEADKHELIAEALFLGAPIAIKRGRQIELSSAAGVDPLLGLRLSLHRNGPDPPITAVHEAASMREPRVRVFRAAEVR